MDMKLSICVDYHGRADKKGAGSNVDLMIYEGNCKVLKLSNETGGGVTTMYQVFDDVCLMLNNFHMEYIGTPVRVWAQFGTSFERSLIAVFELDNAASKTATSKAKRTFKQMIRKLPEFDKDWAYLTYWSLIFFGGGTRSASVFPSCQRKRPTKPRLSTLVPSGGESRCLQSWLP